VLLRENYCIERAECIVRSSARCEDQPCSWVRKGGREREREEERYEAKLADRTVCFHLNISRIIALWM
jgi:hypothetical protein